MVHLIQTQMTVYTWHIQAKDWSVLWPTPWSTAQTLSTHLHILQAPRAFDLHIEQFDLWEWLYYDNVTDWLLLFHRWPLLWARGSRRNDHPVSLTTLQLAWMRNRSWKRRRQRPKRKATNQLRVRSSSFSCTFWLTDSILILPSFMNRNSQTRPKGGSEQK